MERIIENIRIMPGKYVNDMAQHNVIAYALRNQCDSPTGGSAVFPIEVESIDEQFQIVKDKYKKNDGRQIFHMCLSYKNEVHSTRERALDEAKKVSDRIGKEFQNVYGLHEDTDNIHIHFAVNSVSYCTGKKLTSERIMELLQE